MGQIHFKKKDIRTLLNPISNQSDNVQKVSIFFLEKYFKKTNWAKDVYDTAFEHFSSDSKNPVPGYSVQAAFYPPVLDYCYWRVSSRSKKIANKEFFDMSSKALPRYNTHRLFLIDHFRDIDDCPDLPRMVSVSIKAGNVVLDAERVEDADYGFLHGARINFFWKTFCHFKLTSDPIIDRYLQNPFAGTEMIVCFEINRRIKLKWK